MSEAISSAAVYNLPYLEELYAGYVRDHQSVPEAWRTLFSGLHNGGNGQAHPGPSFRARSLFNPPPMAAPRRLLPELDPLHASVRDRLNQLIRNYRVRGHMLAHLDPLGAVRPTPPELELDYYGFRESDLDLLTGCSTLRYDEPLTIREIVHRLRNTYCRSIGVQFMHLDDPAARDWLQRRMESTQNRLTLSRDEQLRILVRLTDAVIFEEFLRKKFLGAKTFSLEGSETLIPLLDLAIEKASRQGVRDVVIGMAHRGRLNVLANIIGKPISDTFREFADAEPELWTGRGDVRYHLGASGIWTTAEGARVQLALCFNPSHLEFINPVVPGRVRARQDARGDRDRRQVLGVLIHGDAAFPGEGIVQETLNLSQLAGYRVGGVLHVVINNQIGFTTPPSEERSTVYATDVARMLQSPVFHVNGEDPEAVAQVVRLTLDYRSEFRTDVFIDMYGYRRWGHNETDEPSFTQPLLYRAIHQRPSIRESYLEHLRQLKGVTAEEAEEIAHQRREKLEQQLNASRQEVIHVREQPGRGETANPVSSQSDLSGGPEGQALCGELDTGVQVKRLGSLLVELTRLPKGFHLHPKLERGMEARRKMAAGEHPLDWSTAEALALASLATEGVRIRLTGQDAPRGTFSQRHAVLFDQEEGFPHIPLQHLARDQAPVEIRNSPLSEAGCVGFEYGYSLDCPDGLVLWEAQFGDFVNAAQVYVDQFIASAEDKWRQLSGLVLLLPHGFEGMGPEHSSARLERFLQLAAEDNIRVVQPTTPAQYFHCLRRQARSKKRKPLIVLTPKSLLRHPKVVSDLTECTQGGFQCVLPDDPIKARTAPREASGVRGIPALSKAAEGAALQTLREASLSGPNAGSALAQQIKRVLLCSGKVYYELAAYREQHQRTDVAIVRLEQLYPLSVERLEAALPQCQPGTRVFWVQEEPQNMGAWRYVHERLGTTLRGHLPLRPVCRAESASPATGSAGAHKLEQEQLMHRAFGEL
jgi:2-oxoglutarate dehydrogenase E1 component